MNWILYGKCIIPAEGSDKQKVISIYRSRWCIRM